MSELDALAGGIDEGGRGSEWHRSRLDLWNTFCCRHRVAEESVPLFACDSDGNVLTKQVGTKRPRTVLRRNPQMEMVMRREVKKASDDHTASLDFHGQAFG